jgi:hypothetical protein
MHPIHSLDYILIVLALISFGLEIIGFPSKINLVALGLFLLTLTLII